MRLQIKRENKEKEYQKSSMCDGTAGTVVVTEGVLKMATDGYGDVAENLESQSMRLLRPLWHFPSILNQFTGGDDTVKPRNRQESAKCGVACAGERGKKGLACAGRGTRQWSNLGWIGYFHLRDQDLGIWASDLCTRPGWLCAIFSANSCLRRCQFWADSCLAILAFLIPSLCCGPSCIIPSDGLFSSSTWL